VKPKTRKSAVSRRTLPAAVILSALTLLAFSNSFQSGFAWDDEYLILKDPRIRGATAENIGLIFRHTYWWPTGEAGIYRPLTTLSYLFNYSILGQREQPAGYHLINLILHTMNVLLVYFLALRLIRRFWPSVFIAAVWGVHPVLTESVTNIVGRADLLAAFGILSGFLIYLKSTESMGWRRRALLTGLMAVTCVGVYSKESAVMIAGVIALYELAWCRERRQARARLLGGLAVLPPIALMLWQRSAALATAAPAEWPFTDNPIIGADFWTGRLTAIAVIARYLRLAVWPAKLSVDYSYSEIPLARGSVGDSLAWTTVAAAVIVIALLYRSNRTAFFFACFAALTFLPTANLLFPIGTIMAERFLYLPLIGLVACVVLAIYSIERRFPPIAPAVLCLMVAGLAVGAWARNLDWKDNFTLVSADVRASPNSFKLHKVMASLLYGLHANPERISEETEKTLSILDPLPDAINDSDAYRWAGGFYLEKGDLPRALKILQRCIAIGEAHRQNRPPVGVMASAPEAYRLLSAVYLRLGDTQNAAAAATRARLLDPLNPRGYRQSAEVHLANGNGEAAAIALMEGFLITSDSSLREDLVSLYRSGLDTKGCAVAPGANGPMMNPSCETVHRHICAASAGLAPKLKERVARDFGCSSGQLY
jgi:hypothetical protein